MQGPIFREVEDSGIDFTYRNGEEAKNLSILESLGGGVALHRLRRRRQARRVRHRRRRLRRPRQQDHRRPAVQALPQPRRLQVPGRDEGSRPGRLPLAFYTHGAAVADYDRDGWPDLLVTGWGRVALFHNEPVDPSDPAKGRKFVEVKDSGLDGITWATSAAWADFDGDGYPDIYIDQYVDWSWANNPPCNYDGHTPGRVPAEAVQRPATQAVRQPGRQGRHEVQGRHRRGRPEAGRPGRQQGPRRPGRGRQRRRQAGHLRLQRHGGQLPLHQPTARRGISSSRRSASRAARPCDDHGAPNGSMGWTRPTTTAAAGRRSG